MSDGRRCGHCPHAFHRDQCPGQGPSRCVTMLTPATGARAGIACTTTRAPCPCPWGECHDCGCPVAGASTLPLYDGSPEIDIERGSAGDPDGTWAVWQLADGTLACRPIEPGGPIFGRELRGREHTVCRVRQPAGEGT
jgi:hypothetical protein